MWQVHTKKNYHDNGNMLLDQLCGAKIHLLNLEQDCSAYAAELMARLTSEGKRPYLIPIGGSNVIGSLGYVRCALEILQQLDAENQTIDQIVLATGSAGTQAGLLAGLIMTGSTIPVLGICVSRSGVAQQTLVSGLLQELLRYLGLDPVLADGRVFANGDYYGEGYGMATASMVSAVKQCAQLEGLLLDPVYTGKGMAGLIDLCQQGVIAQGSRQLFLHTGGSPALFAYRDVF